MLKLLTRQRYCAHQNYYYYYKIFKSHSGLQAYGVLDKYKISKTFFVKTDQAECAYLDSPPEEEKLTEKPSPEKRKRKPQPAEANENLRSAPVHDVDTAINEKAEVEAELTGEKTLSDIPKIIAEELPTKLEQPLETIPERILKIAEAIREDTGDTKDKMIIVEVNEENIAESPKEEKSVLSKETEATA